MCGDRAAAGEKTTGHQAYHRTVIGEKSGNDSVLAQLIRWFGRKKNVEKVGQAVSLKIDDRKFQE